MDYEIIKYILEKFPKLYKTENKVEERIEYAHNRAFWTNMIIAIEINHKNALLNNLGNIALSKYGLPYERLISNESFEKVLTPKTTTKLDLFEDFHRNDSQNVLKVFKDKRLISIFEHWFILDFLDPIIKFIRNFEVSDLDTHYFVENERNGNLFIELFDKAFSKDTPKIRILLKGFTIERKK